MKININTEENAGEIEINITCGRLTPEIEKTISLLRMLEMKLTGKKDGETFLLVRVYAKQALGSCQNDYDDGGNHRHNCRIYGSI